MNIFTFDGAAKTIKVLSGVRSITAKRVYSEWKNWVLAGNANYPPAFVLVGGDDLGNNLRSPTYYFLDNGWKIEPASENHTLDVKVNLYSKDGSDPFKTPASGQVRIVNNTSDAQAIEITLTGGSSSSGLTDSQAAQLTSLHDYFLGDTTPEFGLTGVQATKLDAIHNYFFGPTPPTCGLSPSQENLLNQIYTNTLNGGGGSVTGGFTDSDRSTLDALYQSLVLKKSVKVSIPRLKVRKAYSVL